MFYNSTFNKANLNLLIYRDLPEALKLQKMCKLNSLAVITAQTVEIKPFALQSSSKWIPGLIAKRVHGKNTVGHQFTKDISDAPVLEFGHYCASTSQPQTYNEVSHFKTTWILFLQPNFGQEQSFLFKSPLSELGESALRAINSGSLILVVSLPAAAI